MDTERVTTEEYLRTEITKVQGSIMENLAGVMEDFKRSNIENIPDGELTMVHQIMSKMHDTSAHWQMFSLILKMWSPQKEEE